MEKINYQKELEKIISQCKAEDEKQKPSLLLHACCGPCSSYVIEYLSSIFDITIYYYNPNIHPKAEYERRLEELKKFLTVFPDAVNNHVKIIIDTYDPEEYFTATNVKNEPPLQTEPEKGERCRRCYSFRMKRSWDYACKNNFDFFTTTLSISPHKDSQKINQIGMELEQSRKLQAADNNSQTDKSNELAGNKKVQGCESVPQVCRTRFLFSDFKKKGGFLRSTRLSAEYGLWRQDYCGCVYSMKNNEEEKE